MSAAMLVHFSIDLFYKTKLLRAKDNWNGLANSFKAIECVGFLVFWWFGLVQTDLHSFASPNNRPPPLFFQKRGKFCIEINRSALHVAESATKTSEGISRGTLPCSQLDPGITASLNLRGGGGAQEIPAGAETNCSFLTSGNCWE